MRPRLKIPTAAHDSAQAGSLAVLALSLLVLGLFTLCACGSGTTVTATPHASSGSGQVQPAERHGHLGDAIVLSDGGDGQLEVTALGLKFMRNIATGDSTVANVYGVKLKLRNVGSAPLHMADVGANSVLFDVGGWRYFPAGDNPKNALTEVDLGPGDSRVGWVYFAVQVTGGAPEDFGAPNDFQYTAKSADVAAEGDAGQWRWTPL
jgi:hypothetical protein